MKRIVIFLLAALCICFVAGCAAGGQRTQSPAPETEPEGEPEVTGAPTDVPETFAPEPAKTKGQTLQLAIDGVSLSVVWEDNDSVDALKALAAEGGVTVQMSMYGGFEQVGALNAALPRNDVQITTTAGDIVLYRGDQIVIFYGSNSWAYTRLGRIEGRTQEELAALLGSVDVQITLSLQDE